MLFKHRTLFTALACFLIKNYHGICYHLSPTLNCCLPTAQRVYYKIKSLKTAHSDSLSCKSLLIMVHYQKECFSGLSYFLSAHLISLYEKQLRKAPGCAKTCQSQLMPPSQQPKPSTPLTNTDISSVQGPLLIVMNNYTMKTTLD